jgi:hypothetical protein
MTSTKRIGFAKAFIRQQTTMRSGEVCQAPTAKIAPATHTSNAHKHECAEGCGWDVPCYEPLPCDHVRVCKSCLDGIYI